MSLYKEHSIRNILYISFGALILGHLLTLTNLVVIFFGFIIITLFIYNSTLRKNDFFSFIMVIYFINHFNYFNGYGGGFNIVAFFSILLFIILKKRMPLELKIDNKLLTILISILLMSSILGWFFNFVGEKHHLVISVTSFFGIILLLIVTTRLFISKFRIVTFLKLNLVLAGYSIIVSTINYLGILSSNSPMLPIRNIIDNQGLDMGGVFGSSPVYGENSMIMVILFITFLLFNKNQLLSVKTLIFGIIFSFINIIFSASRSALILSLIGLLLIIIFQYKIIRISIKKQVLTIFTVFFISLISILFARMLGLNYIFERLSNFEDQYYHSGGSGLTFDRFTDGSVFGRKESFYLGIERYFSKDSWLIGYGWNTSDNNRYAFYTDTAVLQGSAHSQIFAVLFLLGWIGFFAYYCLYFISIYKSFRLSGSKISGLYHNRLLAFAFSLMMLMFIINEIKVDSISVQYYFGATIIILGLSYANINTIEMISSQKKLSDTKHVL